MSKKDDTAQRSQRKTAGTIVAIVALLGIALVAFLVMQILSPPAKGEMVAKVTVYGEVQSMMPLSKDDRQVFVTDEGTNVVVVEGGSVHIEDADCPGGDCMKQGTIDSPSQLLVCLPHQLIVEIVPSDGNTAPSVYTGNEKVGSDDIDVVVK